MNASARFRSLPLAALLIALLVAGCDTQTSNTESTSGVLRAVTMDGMAVTVQYTAPSSARAFEYREGMSRFLRGFSKDSNVQLALFSGPSENQLRREWMHAGSSGVVRCVDALTIKYAEDYAQTLGVTLDVVGSNVQRVSGTDIVREGMEPSEVIMAEPSNCTFEYTTSGSSPGPNGTTIWYTCALCMTCTGQGPICGGAQQSMCN